MVSKTSQITEDVSEEQVRSFLEAHPDFLDQNPELLTRMNLSHQPGGGAVSLLEKQVQVLRDQQAKTQQQFEQLSTNAELNQKLLEKIENFTIDLLDCRSRQALVSRTHQLLEELFTLNYSLLLIESAAWSEIDQGVMRLNDEQLEALAELIGTRQAYMGEVPQAVSDAVPDLESTGLGSVALVPLALEKRSGYMLLGSDDELRFRKDMGADFLTYLASLLGRLLDRLE